MPTAIPTDKAYAWEQDAHDNLAPLRGEFVVDDPNLIYLDGNSLGRLCLRTANRTREVVEREWGQRLIRAWNEGWFDLPARIGAKIAQLIGAGAEEVVVADSTSVSLFKLAVAALDVQANRPTILTDDLNFPSDLYVLQGAADHLGNAQQVRILPSSDGIHGPSDALMAAIDENTALVALSLTTFKSAFTYDMAAITRKAHEHGALVLWDLSHAAGVLSLDLNAAGADLAVGCTYKYLNGGPGAPAFLFVRRGLQGKLRNPIPGWFGQHKPFDFDLVYRPAIGIGRFLTGTPPILSLAAMEPGIDLLLEARIDAVRAKSLQQTEYLISLWEQILAPLGFTLNSPRNGALRGSHVSLGHEDGLRIDRALIEEMQVLPDFRYPDNIRLGIAPLYTSFADIWEAVDRLRLVVTQRLFEKYPAKPPAVT
jgi:kynureninase